MVIVRSVAGHDDQLALLQFASAGKISAKTSTELIYTYESVEIT